MQEPIEVEAHNFMRGHPSTVADFGCDCTKILPASPLDAALEDRGRELAHPARVIPFDSIPSPKS